MKSLDARREMKEIEEQNGPLFETHKAKGGFWFKIFAGTVFVGVVLIWFYRVLLVLDASGGERVVLVGLLASDLWFGFYWILTLSHRWNPNFRNTFKNRLSSRYEDNKLPVVDIYVCTANPQIEPPSMVVSTVLSVMAYNYPTNKLNVYLSDDGGSILTFYALWEASSFAKLWIPFCKKFNVSTRSPAAYFSDIAAESDCSNEEWRGMRSLYKEMENRIDDVVKAGEVPDEVRKQHNGFLEWTSTATSNDHQPIVQILIDGRKQGNIESAGVPTLVYVAREKRPEHFHNFKGGAMNTLIRVSSEISNGQVILNVDCDMFANNPEAVRDALCFFMDEEKGNEIGYVQFPQSFNNITKNDIYGNSVPLISAVEFHGLDGYGGPLYIGSGCFHRRYSLMGNKYNPSFKQEWITETQSSNNNIKQTKSDLERRAVALATCTFEQNTLWGKEIGLKYGFPVEDVITGLSIQCRGWKSIYFNPKRRGFLGIAPMTLGQMLVQHKRWSEGDFQIFLSKYCPFKYGYRKIKLGLMMGYSVYFLWVPNAFPLLYYAVVPSLYFLVGIPLFPNISSPWILPFAYVIIATTIENLIISLRSGMTLKGWWNEQRIWTFKRTTSYLFAFIDTLLKLMGLSSSTFVITEKIADNQVLARYEGELMEFGNSAQQMFVILSTIAVLNFACLVGGVLRLVVVDDEGEIGRWVLQILLCLVLVLMNIPVYNAMCFRKDDGRIPTPVIVKGVGLGLGFCLVSIAIAMADS